ncbi:MAG: hypothetical protein HY956_01300 [Deltaproteobacteria bacterium]|nr:hypothetical protein [Deltaproteobacteria bacterium]
MVKRRSSILYLLLALWLIGAFHALKAEVGFYRIIPELLKTDFEGREAFIGGPLRNLSSRAAALIPGDAAIYFFNPPVEGASHYSGKARYYLYPRKIISVDAGADLPEIRQGDYLMLFVPPEFMDSTFERDLLRLVPASPVFEHADEKGRQALYRVGAP